LRALLAAYRDKRDLIAIGAYERGSDPLTDQAIDLKDTLDGFLKQRPDESVPGPDADDQLLRAVGYAGASLDDLADRMLPELAERPAAPALATGPSALPPLNLGVS
jgi:flagellum-specific ATP synthase